MADMGRVAARFRERGRAAPREQRQAAFPFLAELPYPRPRERPRAFRPHLRTRSVPGGVQLVLPLRSPPAGCRYVGVEGMYMEEALRGARAGEAAAVARLLELTRPEVREVAQAAWNPRCGLEVEELQALGEARLVELHAWLRFEPGRERGRTLWPAYARRLARQAMATALRKEGPVHVTQWARRTGAVEEEPSAAPLEAAAHLPAKAGEELLAELAVMRLARLPVRERVAVAAPLGLLKEGRLSDARVARHLGCSLAEVVELRERGLERLREAMGA